jgi:hypothetical protein
MKIFRRILFFVLIAGAFAAIPSLSYQYSASEFGERFGSFSAASAFGLLLWAITFLNVEPKLTRIGLLVIAIYVLGIYFWMALHPDG